MVTSTLVDTLRRARASWRGQLGVLAVGAVVLGLTMVGGGDAGDLRLRAVVASVETLLLIAASIRMALNTEAGFDGDLASVVTDAIRYSPRLVTQVGLFAVVPALVTWLALHAASAMPMVGLVTVPLAFAVFVFTIGPSLLAISAVVQHDRDWLPRSTIRAMRGHNLQVVGIVLCGGVAASFAALPLVLVGFVVNAVGGMLGFVGIGLGAASALPLFGCGSLATWRALGARIAMGVPATSEEPGHGSAPPAPGAGVDLAVAFGVAPAAQAVPGPGTTWLDGPTWDVAVEPGAVWGTWIRIDAPSVLGFRVAWHDGAAPELAFASEAGAWTRTDPLAASGDVLQAALPAGSTYVQVTSRASVPQAVTLRLLVPPAVAA